MNLFEVRVNVEIGSTDGDTLIRLDQSESIVPANDSDDPTDVFVLAKAMVDSLCEATREKALDQVDQLARLQGVQS